MKRLLASVVFMAAAPLATAAGQLHLFNWNDYIAEDTVTAFEKS